MSDRIFKALSDPTRRTILRLLGRGDMSAGDVAEHFKLSAGTVSHHFNVLKDADLVTVRRSGNQLYYILNATVFQEVLAIMLDIIEPDKRTVEE